MIERNIVIRPAHGVRHACPCCGFLTLSSRGWHETCPVCYWDDDGQDDHDADVCRGGANLVSLTEARRNFKAFRASDRRRTKYVRDPLPEEVPAQSTPQ